jgi:ubiquinone/menaquinone biosynthesis C-methylase UbiE
MSRFEFTKKEVEEYLQSIDYKKCKIKEMLYFYKNKELSNYYRDPESFQQISSIMKLIDKYSNLSNRETTIDIFSRLSEVLCRKLNTRNYFKVVDKLKYHKYKDDKVVFNFIKDLRRNNKGRNFYYTQDKECQGRNIIAENIEYVMRDLKLPKNLIYLDYGFGDGSKTMAVKNKLNIPIENVHGLEVEVVFDGQENSREKIKFDYQIIKKDGKLNYPNNTFNFVTAFVSLHHVTYLDSTLKELNRIIKKDGYLLIQEHDCIDIIDKMLADLEHTWWRMNNAFASKKEINFKDLDSNNYYSWFEWDIIMREYGFKKVKYSVHEAGQKERIQPTRLYYLVYQKI